MNPARYAELDAAGKGLTPLEVAEGWHFCSDWDGMLIGPGWSMELECCSCLPREHKVYRVKEKEG